jgi:hypothetical protein
MAESSEQPLFVSKPSSRSLWQEYRVYGDRLELDTLPFGIVRVPLSDIAKVSVRPPLVIFDVLRGDYGLGDILRAPKLDFADLHEHVAIEKSTGFWRQFRITPGDPQAFVQAVEQARNAPPTPHN